MMKLNTCTSTSNGPRTVGLKWFVPEILPEYSFYHLHNYASATVRMIYNSNCTFHVQRHERNTRQANTAPSLFSQRTQVANQETFQQVLHTVHCTLYTRSFLHRVIRGTSSPLLWVKTRPQPHATVSVPSKSKQFMAATHNEVPPCIVQVIGP